MFSNEIVEAGVYAVEESDDFDGRRLWAELREANDVGEQNGGRWVHFWRNGAARL